MTYIKLTMATFDETMRTSVCQVFYIVSYEAERIHRELMKARAPQ